jgi:hypothetical protein
MLFADVQKGIAAEAAPTEDRGDVETLENPFLHESPLSTAARLVLPNPESPAFRPHMRNSASV